MIEYLKELKDKLIKEKLFKTVIEIDEKIKFYTEMEKNAFRWIRLTTRNAHRYIGHRVRYKWRGKIKCIK